MRLIDGDALIRELKGIKVTFGSGNGLVEGGIEVAISTTNAQPTVDAVERKRGEWIRRPSPDKYHCGYVICPFCNVEYVESDEYNFCPNCGADMRGENNG